MLLSTKLTPLELAAFTMPRPRLFAWLDEALVSKTTLVLAPAGYGKTTLITHWLAQTDHHQVSSTWLILDDYDDEPVRFMRYFIAALQRVVPDIGAHTPDMLQSSPVTMLDQTIETIMTLLMNDLAQHQTPIVFVLDDVHILSNAQIVNGLRFWIERTPPTVHTVLITRDATMLPIARWKVRDYCRELSIRDLQFTEAEANIFVRERLQINLTDDHILQLTNRTEGWIAGLQLACLSLQTADNPTTLLQQFTGSDRYVTDYLIEEVLQKQPEHLYRFLLQTSILKQLSPALCNSIMATTGSHQVLEQLEKGMLFLIPLDNQRHWYRYHPLFAEALQSRLYASHADQVAELHHRAYAWLLAEGDIEAAIEHALAGGLYTEAAAHIYECYQTILWEQGRPYILLRWGERLPRNVLFSIPPLPIAIGWAYVLIGRFEEVYTLTQAMRATWTADYPVFANAPETHNELTILEAEVAVNQGNAVQTMQLLEQIDLADGTLRPNTPAIFAQLYGYALRLHGNVDAAKRSLQEAIRLTAQEYNQSVWLFAHADLAETYIMAGELSTARALYQTILQHYPIERYPNYASLAYIYMCLARIYYLQNQLQEATDYIQRGLNMDTMSTWFSHIGIMTLVDIRQIQGQRTAVESLINRLHNNLHTYQSHLGRMTLSAFLTRSHLLRGQVKQAEAWATTYKAYSESIPRYQFHHMDVTYGRYLVSTDPPAAIPFLTTLRDTAKQENWQESLLEIAILLTRAYQVLDRPQDALAEFSNALNTAEPEQIITPFVIEGAPMVPLLREAAKTHSHRAFIGQIQAAFLPITNTVAQPLNEPLTKRELEVLQMMADGLSNPEIAERLMIAVGTVAKHTNNIFGKLEARNRTEATQRAHALGLM